MNSNKTFGSTFMGRLLAGAGLLLAMISPVRALDIATTPLFIPTPLSPNVIVTLDDSGSMQWAFAPDSMCGLDNVADACDDYPMRRFKSAHFNALYYNPNTTYLPALDASGNAISPCTDASSTSACFGTVKINGFDSGRGTRNLTSDYRPTTYYDPSSTSQGFANNPAVDFPGQTTAGVAAYYYVFDSNAANCSTAPLSEDEDCYVKVTVGDAEKMNFARWYAFYRTRNLMTVTGASRAFAGLNSNARVAWQALNSCKVFGTTTAGTSCDSWSSSYQDLDNRIKTFGTTHKTNFYNWLFHLRASGGTPLRSAFKRAGQYYQRSGVNSPYAQDPQVTLGTEYSCRPNFHIAMTDGRWNSDGATDGDPSAFSDGNNSPTDFGNADGTNLDLPGTVDYSASATGSYIYNDSNSNSVADIAFYYWGRDLRGDLTNNLMSYIPQPNDNASTEFWDPRNDPADWQHMVNFTVGLGLGSEMGADWTGDTYGGAYASFKDGSREWPATGKDVTPGNVYDLWHAALNSRGQFFSADEPQSLNQAFQDALNRITERESAAAALATNSTRLGTDTAIFQAKFNTGDWSGQLIAYAINNDPNVGPIGEIGSALWDATEGEHIPAHADRKIATWNGSNDGIKFEWNSLTGAQQTSIGSSAVLDYLRGNQDGEVQNGGTYRNRSKRLGDIINSDPYFVSAPNFGYDVLAEGTDTSGTSYKTFVNDNKSRTKMLYVGANDGMLHAFNADTGDEVFAYVPNAVIPNLAQLASLSYSHKYYVDGSPFAGDAFISSAWKTVLLGSTGAGGKAVFALDVTSPSTLTTADAVANAVMWEYTHAELGYTIGQPVIARLADGTWAAVFGNGYNSTSHKAQLFIVDLATGTLKKLIDTEEGDATNQNGLGSPILYDSNNDRIIDTIYAADLRGNVWKFDVSNGSNTGTWGVAYKQGATPKPLFTARSSLGQVQPISAPLELGAPPSGQSGLMVYFGTGRFFVTGDITDTTVQSFYGILDSGTRISATDRSGLQQQSILGEVVDGDETYLGTTANTVDYATKRGWYLDLTNAVGERVIGPSQLRYGRVIFNTQIPSSNPCDFGGGGWEIQLNATNGGRLDYSYLDRNNDGVFSNDDFITINGVTIAGSGRKSKVGIVKSTTFISAGEKEYSYGQGSKPDPNGDECTSKGINCDVVQGQATGKGRVSWYEILED